METVLLKFTMKSNYRANLDFKAFLFCNTCISGSLAYGSTSSKGPPRPTTGAQLSARVTSTWLSLLHLFTPNTPSRPAALSHTQGPSVSRPKAAPRAIAPVCCRGFKPNTLVCGVTFRRDKGIGATQEGLLASLNIISNDSPCRRRGLRTHVASFNCH